MTTGFAAGAPINVSAILGVDSMSRFDITMVSDGIMVSQLSFTPVVVDSNFVLKGVLTTNEFRFGAPVALDGGVALVGNPSNVPDSARHYGTASAFIASSGTPLQRFDNPNPGALGTVDTDFYAYEQWSTVDIKGGYVLISAMAEDWSAPDGTVYVDSGAVYVFDATNGALVRTLHHPAPVSQLGGAGFGQGFGREISASGEAVLVATSTGIASASGEAYLYNFVTGDLICSLTGPFGFGTAVALSPEHIAVGYTTKGGSSGAVWIYDRTTCSFRREINNPTPEVVDFFGEEIAIDGNRILVGAGQVDVAGATNAGEASLFSLQDGSLLHTFVDPTPTQSAFFGRHLDIESDVLVISAVGNNEVHVFDANTGTLLQTLRESSVPFNLGTTVDLDTNGDLLVGSPAGPGAFFYSRASAGEAPTSEAGPNQAIHAGQLVTLDGSGSLDDTTATEALLYSWSFESVPTSSQLTVLDNADTVSPSFVADADGDFVVRLVVTDADGLSSLPDIVTVSSSNVAPTASAGFDVGAIVNQSVALDGSLSNDADFDTLSYSWTFSSRPAGSAAIIASPNSVSPSFVPDLAGNYVVELVVNDGLSSSAPDEVVISVVSAESFAELVAAEAITTIGALPAGSVTTLGNQTMMGRLLSQVIAALQVGDIPEALLKLEHAIQRTDGCVLRGAPDEQPRKGGAPPLRDFVTDCDAQESLYASLVQAHNALQ